MVHVPLAPAGQILKPGDVAQINQTKLTSLIACSISFRLLHFLLDLLLQKLFLLFEHQ